VRYRNTALLTNISWSRWSAREAIGSGSFYANQSGPVPATVRLRKPKWRCGHRVFTRAVFTFKDIKTAKSGLAVDERLPQSSCRS
jgi:hypothetical protein